MSFLSLKGIGKIYVGDGNVAVGIRGVDLSFDKGEFVAITGKSGSGKSTLLNVISGMDTYEEGELYIEGEPTSHYRQSDWEAYRQKYVSFIFQDYNIIDSFTVLENVELALMHISNPLERRKRAVELLTRVGMAKFLRQRGSKLSGGQKQRTVIARALAKDSPIILADEPTGNLDSATAKEIIELLYEVSRDKLLIVVTHNFEQVEGYATRQIRIYDGGVEFDHKDLARPNATADETVSDRSAVSDGKKPSRVRNGLRLGWALFKSMPKLSVFMCLMMAFSALGLFLAATFFGDAWSVFKPNYLFSRREGRVIVVARDESLPTIGKLDDLINGNGNIAAKDYLRCDLMLDAKLSVKPTNDTGYFGSVMQPTYGEDFGNNIIGRYPRTDDEVFLYLPIDSKTIFGDKADNEVEIEYFGSNNEYYDYYPISGNNSENKKVTLKVVGLKYYYDNNLDPKIMFTKSGLETVTCVFLLKNGILSGSKAELSVKYSDNTIITTKELFPYYSDEEFIRFDHSGHGVETEAKFSFYRNVNNQAVSYETDVPIGYFNAATDNDPDSSAFFSEKAIVSTALLKKWAIAALDATYQQASLFFKNDREARSAVKALDKNGYIAVLSDVTAAKSDYEVLFDTIIFFVSGAIMLGLIVFFAFFVNLVTRRSLDVFKGDISIMRSMGISAGDIKLASYVRVLMAVLPSIPFIAIVAILIFTNPITNPLFTYLYWWHYALIFIGLMLLSFFVTRMQIKRLFKDSVKQTMRREA